MTDETGLFEDAKTFTERVAHWKRELEGPKHRSWRTLWLWKSGLPSPVGWFGMHRRPSVRDQIAALLTIQNGLQGRIQALEHRTESWSVLLNREANLNLDLSLRVGTLETRQGLTDSKLRGVDAEAAHVISLYQAHDRQIDAIEKAPMRKEELAFLEEFRGRLSRMFNDLQLQTAHVERMRKRGGGDISKVPARMTALTASLQNTDEAFQRLRSDMEDEITKLKEFVRLGRLDAKLSKKRKAKR